MAKKKKFQCPRCPHQSARKSNMSVHISRRHNGIGLPMPIKDDSPTAYHRANTKLNSQFKRVNSWPYCSEEEAWSFPKYNLWEYPWTYTGDNTNPEVSDWLDRHFRPFQQILSLKQVIGNFRPPRYEQPIPKIPQWDNFDGVLGYLGKACNKCLTVTSIPLYQGQGEITSKIEHLCDTSRLIEVSLFETDVRNNVSSNIEKCIPHSLLSRCKEWLKDEIYLKAFSTTADHISATIVDIAEIDKENWLMRTINNSQTSVNDAELLEFLKMAKDKTGTFAYICDSSGQSQDSSYLIAVIRKPVGLARSVQSRWFYH
jgi:hypothetical protein